MKKRESKGLNENDGEMVGMGDVDKVHGKIQLFVVQLFGIWFFSLKENEGKNNCLFRQSYLT